MLKNETESSDMKALLWNLEKGASLGVMREEDVALFSQMDVKAAKDTTFKLMTLGREIHAKLDRDLTKLLQDGENPPEFVEFLKFAATLVLLRKSTALPPPERISALQELTRNPDSWRRFWDEVVEAAQKAVSTNDRKRLNRA